MSDKTSIQEYTKTEQAIATLRKKYGGALYEVETTDGMRAAKEARAEIKGYRVDLEKLRKKIKAPALDRCRAIDTEAKRITNELLKLEGPIDEQIQVIADRIIAEKRAKIDAENKRVADLQDRIAGMRRVVETAVGMNYSAAALAELIAEVESAPIGEEFAEFTEAAEQAKTETLSRLEELHGATVIREEEDARLAAERADLERLRAEQEKREAAEREKERIAFEAQRKEQAEAQAKINAERAEIEREKAEAARKAEAEAAERQRIEEAAKKARFPGIAAIVDAIAQHFGVTNQVARKWIDELGGMK